MLRTAVILFFLLMVAGGASAQQFLFTQHSTGLPAIGYSATAWGDYDLDGDLDLAMTGTEGNLPITRIFRNDGGTFTDIQALLQPVHYGSAEWGDYDTDGDPDLLVTGIDAQGTPHTLIFTNNAGNFVPSGIVLPGVMDGQATFGDLNNDGRPDILVAGSGMARILRNEGNGVFTDIGAPLPTVETAMCCWTDFDNDGQQDVMVCGNTGGGIVSALYRNDHGTFTAVTPAPESFYGLYGGQVKWADFDGDGDNDLVLAGTDLYVDGYCIFYRNDSGGHFTRFDHPPAALLNPYFDIADYNADGLPDVLMIGASPGCGGPPVTLLLKNQGGFDFTDVSTLIPGFKLGCVNWGDGNGDGYPDLLLTGLDAYDVAHTALYLNNLGDTTLFQINTAPSQPSGTSAGMEGDHAVLQWNPATDLQTPAASLTYNLSIGTTPGGSDILSPLSDTATGFCRLSCMGNAGYDTAWIVSGIPAGTYYFSVQPVDAGFLAGEFSAPCPFAYLPVGMNEPGLPGITVYPNPCREFVRLEAPTRAGSPEPVQIFNSLGIKFFEGRIPATLDVSRWPEGIYLLDQPGKVRTKLVKQ